MTSPYLLPYKDSVVTGVGAKGVSQNHLLSFDDNKLLKLSIGYDKHLFKCTGA